MKKNLRKNELNKVSGGIRNAELLQQAETHNMNIKIFGTELADKFLDSMIQFSWYEKDLIRDKAKELQQTVKK